MYKSQEWYERSTSLSQHAQKQFQESNRVRQNTAIVKDQVAQNDKLQLQKVYQFHVSGRRLVEPGQK